MPHLLVHHKVKDFPTWKAGYDDHKHARDAAGLKELHLLQGAEDPNDVVLLFAAEDLGKMREFLGSDDLKDTMARLGVVPPPLLVELA
ncbi:MAG: cyclase [Akkermansiaceae bacterium]|nr:cyclase [Akkermansiaceae bacterium]